MMTASDGLTAPAALNPFNGRDVPQPPPDSVPAYTRSPTTSAASGNYSALPTVDQIEYQNIAHTGSGSKISIEVDDSSKDGLEGVRSSATASPTPSSASAPFYSLAYYKSYFDITTDTLFYRIGRAINPTSAPFYTDETSAPPDLYGPFWITSTLILLIAVCSNLASYIDWKWARDPELDEGDVEAWKYDFSKLSVATSVFYSLISWLPVVLYFVLSRSGQAKGLVDIISVMGYSFSPLLFVTLLLVIPSTVLQWVVVAVGCVLQAWFLVKNLWTDKSNGKVMPAVILIVAICLGTALLYKWYFF